MRSRLEPAAAAALLSLNQQSSASSLPSTYDIVPQTISPTHTATNYTTSTSTTAPNSQETPLTTPKRVSPKQGSRRSPLQDLANQQLLQECKATPSKVARKSADQTSPTATRPILSIPLLIPDEDLPSCDTIATLQAVIRQFGTGPISKAFKKPGPPNQVEQRYAFALKSQIYSYSTDRTLTDKELVSFAHQKFKLNFEGLAFLTRCH